MKLIYTIKTFGFRTLWDNFVAKIEDIVWWITDGVPVWSDAVECDKKICRMCGNKPL